MYNRKALFQIEEEPKPGSGVAVRFVSVEVDDRRIDLQGREDLECLDERDLMRLLEARDLVRQQMGRQARGPHMPQRVALYWESQGDHMRLLVEG